MKSSIARFAGVIAIFLCGNALATIVGTFDISGIVSVTPTGITWTNSVPPNTANQANIAGFGLTGIYAGIGLGNTIATIDDLNLASNPVGVAFPEQSFIDFDANPALSSLLINFIDAGIYSSSQCSSLPAAVGQTCTTTGSPFSFVNNPPPPPTGPQATATWAVSGVSANGLDTWIANFTSQFTTPFQTVLAAGSFTNAYSAAITVETASSVPEPSTVALMVLALMSMLVFLRRRSKS